MLWRVGARSRQVVCVALKKATSGALDQIVGGAFNELIVDTFHLFSSRDDLIYCGINVGVVDTMSPHDTALAHDDELAVIFVKLGFSLVGSIYRKFLWLVRGWPMNTIRWCGTERQQDVGAKLLKSDETLTEMSSLTTMQRVSI